MEAKALRGRHLGTGSSVAVILFVVALVQLAGASAAGAQFLCPTPAGAGQGVDIAVGTVVVAVVGEDGPPGGFAGMTANMSGGQGQVGSVFFDICFDGNALDIAEAPEAQAPCTADGKCPGDQVCQGNMCIANVVTACQLDSRLTADHELVATSPIIPENPPNPRRLRLAVVDATRNATSCDSDEDCGEDEICPFERCVRTCADDEDCPSGTRCHDIEEESICSPINIIDDGALVRCTFDILETAPLGDTPLDFALLEVADDSIPIAQALPSEGQGGFIGIKPCGPDVPCPTGEVCVNGICKVPTITPTPTPTFTGGTSTPTPTITPTTPPVTSTPTPTQTPSWTGGPTNTPTDTPTEGTATPTGSATPTTTGARAGGDHDGCHCEIVGTERSNPLNSFLVLLAPLLILWGRRRRY